jgi:hypothetical protein
VVHFKTARILGVPYKRCGHGVEEVVDIKLSLPKSSGTFLGLLNSFGDTIFQVISQTFLTVFISTGKIKLH